MPQITRIRTSARMRAQAHVGKLACVVSPLADPRDVFFFGAREAWGASPWATRRVSMARTRHWEEHIKRRARHFACLCRTRTRPLNFLPGQARREG